MKLELNEEQKATIVNALQTLYKVKERAKRKYQEEGKTAIVKLMDEELLEINATKVLVDKLQPELKTK